MPTPPSVIERRVDVRMIRQRVLTERDPPLKLSVVLDESALLREIGGPDVMHAQLMHLAETARLPNVELRVHPLRSSSSLMASSFVLFGLGPQPLSDVVSTETMASGEVYVEGEADTFQFRLLFSSLTDGSLSEDESRRRIEQIAES